MRSIVVSLVVVLTEVMSSRNFFRFVNVEDEDLSPALTITLFCLLILMLVVCFLSRQCSHNLSPSDVTGMSPFVFALGWFPPFDLLSGRVLPHVAVLSDHL